MNAWIFRHIDELQRIYAGPAAGVALRPRTERPPEGPEAGAQAPPAGPDAGDPFSDGPRGASPGAAADLLSEAVPIAPGAVLRRETDEGPDVLLMPFRAPLSRHRRRRLS